VSIPLKALGSFCSLLGALFLTAASLATAQESIIHHFAASAHIIDAQGNLYGTASEGGNYSCTSDGCGIVFELTPSSAPGGSWTKKTIYKFQGSADGGEPTGNLTLLDGNLYGVTLVGGANNAGVVFDVLP
jgi:hypothetical protein